jgi:beta-mannosidase
MDLPRTAIASAVRQISGREFEIEFRAKAFQHQVQFNLDKIPHRADDNFFDLHPDEPRKVRVQTASPAKAADLKRKLTVFSLADAS